MKQHIKNPAAREVVSQVLGSTDSARSNRDSDRDREVFLRFVRESRKRSIRDGFVLYLVYATVATWACKTFLDPTVNVPIAWCAILCGGYTWHVVESYRGTTVSILGFCAAIVAMGLGALGAAIVVGWFS